MYSRVALQFIHEMRSKAIESWDASNSQALPVFNVGVGFVDESILLSKPKCEVELATEDIKSIVSSLLPGDNTMHIASLDNVFSSESEDGEVRLRELVGMITDDTGREDLLQFLRMLSLQKVPFLITDCSCFHCKLSFNLHDVGWCFSFGD